MGRGTITARDTTRSTLRVGTRGTETLLLLVAVDYSTTPHHSTPPPRRQ